MVVFDDHVEVLLVEYEDRKGHWKQIARIECDFIRRIHALNDKLGYVFAKSHRHRMQLYIDKCVDV